MDPALVKDRKKVDAILKSAARAGASDVHIKAGEPILMRVEGKLRAANSDQRLAAKDTERFLRALCAARFEEPDVDRIQELDFSYAVAGAGRFRVNVFRQRGTLALVIRVIPPQVPNFRDLNLPEVVRSISEEQRGLVLVAGTTGSGKSTTLAAMLGHINESRTAHVITIEDPIEFYFSNRKSSIVQREIGADTGSFPVALRAALRQDPDVIMIGEMRDTETIDIAMKAAETGHLVVSTVHTTDAAKTVQRILGVFPTTEQAMVRTRLSECLCAVVSQRLLPRSDGEGLVPAVEVMVATRFVQDCIRDPSRGQDLKDVIEDGRYHGMQSFDQSLLGLLQEGSITREVALGAATSPADLDLRIRLGDSGSLEIDHHNYTVAEGEDERAAGAPGMSADDLPEEEAGSEALPDERRAEASTKKAAAA
jgi:twitching motility protein PilT